MGVLSLGKKSAPAEGLNSLVANEKVSDGVKEFEAQLVGVCEVCCGSNGFVVPENCIGCVEIFRLSVIVKFIDLFY